MYMIRIYKSSFFKAEVSYISGCPSLKITLPLQLYITATRISYCNYPIGKMCCPIMSVIFGEALYLIPHIMTSKRYMRAGNFANLCHFQFDCKSILRCQGLIQDGNLNNLSQLCDFFFTSFKNQSK